MLISVHPKYAEKIFDGSKTVELRRTRPRVEPGTKGVVYVSTPEKSIRGFFTVKEVIEKDTEDLWEDVKEEAGVSYLEYKSYFEGSRKGVGIKIELSSCLIDPIELSEIRSCWPEFHPPQTFRYLSPNQFGKIFGNISGLV